MTTGSYISLENNKDARLSKRQEECLLLLMKGYPAKRVAYELGLSSRTVEQYMSSIKEKLGAANIPHAVAIYLRENAL